MIASSLMNTTLNGTNFQHPILANCMKFIQQHQSMMVLTGIILVLLVSIVNFGLIVYLCRTKRKQLRINGLHNGNDDDDDVDSGGRDSGINVFADENSPANIPLRSIPQLRFTLPFDSCSRSAKDTE